MENKELLERIDIAREYVSDDRNGFFIFCILGDCKAALQSNEEVCITLIRELASCKCGYDSPAYHEFIRSKLNQQNGDE